MIKHKTVSARAIVIHLYHAKKRTKPLIKTIFYTDLQSHKVRGINKTIWDNNNPGRSSTQ